MRDCLGQHATRERMCDSLLDLGVELAEASVFVAMPQQLRSDAYFPHTPHLQVHAGSFGTTWRDQLLHRKDKWWHGLYIYIYIYLYLYIYIHTYIYIFMYFYHDQEQRRKSRQKGAVSEATTSEECEASP